MEGTLNEGTRHTKTKVLKKQMMLSPVYVKRGNSIHSHKIQETSTQTNRAIFELTKQDDGYMSPDSLNSSPRIPAEKDYGVQQVNEVWYKNSPYYIIPAGQRTGHQCIIANNDSSSNQKNVEDLNYNYTGYTINNPDVYTAMPQKVDHNFINQKNFELEHINNSSLGKSFSELNVSQRHKETVTDSFEAAPTKLFDGEMQNNQFEVLHAQVYDIKKKKVLNSHTPIVVNILNKKISPKGKPKQETIDIHINDESYPTALSQVVGKGVTFLKKNKSTFKSQSFIEPFQSKKLLPTGITQRTETFKINSSEVKRLLNFHKSGDADTGKNNIDIYTPKSFQSKRSYSFMNPTVASEQKQSNLKDIKTLSKMLDNKVPFYVPSQIGGGESSLPVENSLSDKEDCPELSSVSSAHSVFETSSGNSDSGLHIIMNHIKSRDWYTIQVEQIITFLRSVSLQGVSELVDIVRQGDPDVFMPFMTLVYQRILELLKTPRSHVCRTACQLVGHIFELIKDTRRPEFDDIVDSLLCKTADTNKFIRHDANLALDCMVTHVPTFHAVRSICAKGPTHRNPLVRCATMRLLICAVVIAGPDFILHQVNQEPTRKRVILNLVVSLEDRNIETRYVSAKDTVQCTWLRKMDNGIRNIWNFDSVLCRAMGDREVGEDAD